MTDLFISSLILVIFFVPSVLILSFVTVFSVNVSATLRKHDPISPRTRLIVYWMILVFIRLFCLWQITASPEGASYYFLGGPVLPESWIALPKAATSEFLLRAFVVLADTVLWAFLLMKMPKRQRKVTMP